MELVTFPIPLREGVVVFIDNIPGDLTKDEAASIARVVEALAQRDSLKGRTE